MGKKGKLIAIVVSIVIVGVAIYFYMKSKTAVTPVQTSTTSTTGLAGLDLVGMIGLM